VRRISVSKSDQVWLKKFGSHLEEVIKKNGYKSAYDFWIQHAGDHLSRATLNFMIAGKTDPKLTTLKKIAELLKVDLNTLIHF
jgi:transcriptional regulator with XRE-family HTH domain